MSDRHDPIPRQTTDHRKIEKTRKELQKTDRPQERDLTTDHEIGDHDDRQSTDKRITPPIRTD